MKNSKKGKTVAQTDGSKQGGGDMLHSDSLEELGSSIQKNNDHDHHQPSNGENISPNQSSPPVSWDQTSSSNAPSPGLFWDESLCSSPLAKSPWSSHVTNHDDNYAYTGLMGSLIREEGHIYSLAATGDLLYTGSDSKNIRVWKNQKEFSGFKSNSGLVKAIIIAKDIIFTGHQDGKIRLWKASAKNPNVHKRIGTLPTFKAVFKSSMNPSSYIEIRRNKNAIWLKHFDAISCLSLNEDQTLLYSASWDKTIKVWRVSNSKCLESVKVHDDAVNAVVAGFDGLVFTGSADGTVKEWRREMQGKGTKHFFSQTLLKQECAVTALSVDPSSSFLYCGSSDGVVNYWERAKLMSHGGLLRGHKLAVLCLAAAGNLVFSGSADTNICVWRREKGDHTCLSVLSGHTGPVKCLAVEDDRDGHHGGENRWMVYSGSLDKSVKIWRVSADMTPMQTYQQGESMNVRQAIPSVQSFSTQCSRTSQRRK